jgi:hypothetical protein
MECVICYTNIPDDQIKTLSPCNHFFHDYCVTTWINSQINSNITPSCPYCRCNTITDIQFEDNDDNLPDLIPYDNIVPRSMIVRLIVDRYVYLLNRSYVSTDQYEINTLHDYIYDYQQKYSNDFDEFILTNEITVPDILPNELESYNIAKNKSKLALINWWTDKSTSYSDHEYNDRHQCLTVAGIIACHYGLAFNY